MKWTKIKAGVYRSGNWTIRKETASEPRNFWRVIWRKGEKRPIKTFYRSMREAKRAVEIKTAKKNPKIMTIWGML